jgi:adenylate cyclase
MATEIERKFLVSGTEWKNGPGTAYCQGYLNRSKERTVRVRIAGAQAFLTIKGLAQGISRLEFEYEIPLADAEQLLTLCDGPLIQKMRYIVHHQGNCWEVDEFFGDNQGLVVAEIELQDENQRFERPAWVGAEVSDDARYFNSNLASQPYSQWRAG